MCLPDSLIVLVNAVVIAFNIFLLTAVGTVFVKALAKNKDVSHLTEGFLLLRASITSSRIASNVVYKKMTKISHSIIK